jgi:hypothetical protein
MGVAEINQVKKKVLTYSFLLLTGSIMLRLIVYLMLPPAKPIADYSTETLLYFSALTDHFADYINFATNIPPLTHVLNAGVLFVTGTETALHIRGFLLLVFAMDILAVMLIFNAAKKAAGDTRMAFAASVLFSSILVPFELWREGGHYDHHTVLFTSFFVWSLVSLIREPEKSKRLFFVSFSGMFMVAQSSVSLVIVPFTLFVIASLLYIPGKRYRTFIRSLLMMLALPLGMLLMISAKNQTQGSESLTSNKGGPAMMMVVQRAYNYDAAVIRKVAAAAGAPEWYLWSYDHATPMINQQTGKPYDWLYLAQAFGICFYGTTAGQGQPPMMFDFNPLLQYLRSNAPAELIYPVQQDSVDAVRRPYRFAGYSPELSPRWIGIFGNVSKDIFLKTLLMNPVGMIKAFVIQHGIFFVHGPLFPYDVMNDKPSGLARSGLRTLPVSIPLHNFFAVVTLLFAFIGWILYTQVLISVPVSVWKIFTEKGFFQHITMFRMLTPPVIGIAIMFSCMVGGENNRYFMQIVPYLIVMLCCVSWQRKKILTPKS